MNQIKHKLSLIILLGVIVSLFLASCDKGFEEMNKNPNAYTMADNAKLFTTSIIRTAGTGTPDRNRTNIKYFAGAMQYMASLGTNWSGDKRIEQNQYGDLFNTIYGTHLKTTIQVISNTEGNSDAVNLNSMAKIWKVYTLHRATDIYGDVPYTEAGLGYIDGNFKPKFDKQSDIYPMMLTELEDAIKQFDASKSTIGINDVIYQGDLIKWKTFANSLMLRLGMRMSEVDPSRSQEWVKKAIAGGVMQNNNDIAKLDHLAGNGNTQNWDAFELKRESFPESNRGTGEVKLSKTLIDALQIRKDPRLPFYATLWEGNILSQQAIKLPITTNPILQKGLPNGYDVSTMQQVVPGFQKSQLADYSEPNSGTISSLNAPTIFISYSEVEFLLAEAALRGWGPGTVSQHYNAAIKANLESTVLFPGDIVISQADIDTYLAENLLSVNSFDGQMEQIYTQFWLAHFMYLDNFEAYSTWRRTGYPKLIPTNYPGNFTGGKPMVRLRYPNEEATLNTENYNVAVANQGPDDYTTHVWWDVD